MSIFYMYQIQPWINNTLLEKYATFSCENLLDIKEVCLHEANLHMHA